MLQGLAEIVRCAICLSAAAGLQRLCDVEELEREIIAKRKPRRRRTCRLRGWPMSDPALGLALLWNSSSQSPWASRSPWWPWAGIGCTRLGDIIFNLFVQRTYAVMTNEVLIAVPLFVFTGLYRRARQHPRPAVPRAAVGPREHRRVGGGDARHLRAVATATGIVGATVTLMGLLALPGDAARRLRCAAGLRVVCAGGTLGILIPPSIMLILYGATAGVSVVKLYAGAFIPGFLLAGMYMLFVICARG